MKIALMAAVAENGVIGRDGGLPWRLPDDLAHLKRLTTGHCIIVGRRTYEFAEFLTEIERIDLRDLEVSWEGSATYHYSCHLRQLGTASPAATPTAC